MVINNYNVYKNYDYNSAIGKVMPLRDFIENVNSGRINSYDGCIGNVIIDGKNTDIKIRRWSLDFDDEGIYMDLYSLEKIKGKVEINWCDK